MLKQEQFTTLERKIERFTNMLEERPKDGLTVLALAEASFRRGLKLEALTAYQQVTREQPVPEAHLAVAEIYSQQNMTTEAYGELRQLFALDPENVEARLLANELQAHSAAPDDVARILNQPTSEDAFVEAKLRLQIQRAIHNRELQERTRNVTLEPGMVIHDYYVEEAKKKLMDVDEQLRRVEELRVFNSTMQTMPRPETVSPEETPEVDVQAAVPAMTMDIAPELPPEQHLPEPGVEPTEPQLEVEQAVETVTDMMPEQVVAADAESVQELDQGAIDMVPTEPVQVPELELDSSPETVVELQVSEPEQGAIPVSVDTDEPQIELVQQAEPAPAPELVLEPTVSDAQIEVADVQEPEISLDVEPSSEIGLDVQPLPEPPMPEEQHDSVDPPLAVEEPMTIDVATPHDVLDETPEFTSSDRNTLELAPMEPQVEESVDPPELDLVPEGPPEPPQASDVSEIPEPIPENPIGIDIGLDSPVSPELPTEVAEDSGVAGLPDPISIDVEIEPVPEPVEIEAIPDIEPMPSPDPIAVMPEPVEVDPPAPMEVATTQEPPAPIEPPVEPPAPVVEPVQVAEPIPEPPAADPEPVAAASGASAADRQEFYVTKAEELGKLTGTLARTRGVTSIFLCSREGKTIDSVVKDDVTEERISELVLESFDFLTAYAESPAYWVLECSGGIFVMQALDDFHVLIAIGQAGANFGALRYTMDKTKAKFGAILKDVPR